MVAVFVFRSVAVYGERLSGSPADLNINAVKYFVPYHRDEMSNSGYTAVAL